MTLEANDDVTVITAVETTVVAEVDTMELFPAGDGPDVDEEFQDDEVVLNKGCPADEVVLKTGLTGELEDPTEIVGEDIETDDVELVVGVALAEQFQPAQPPAEEVVPLVPVAVRLGFQENPDEDDDVSGPEVDVQFQPEQL